MKLGELLLLLAVTSSRVEQVFLVPPVGPGPQSISQCPITYFGKSFSVVDLSFSPNPTLCFKNNISEPSDDCVAVETPGVTATEADFNTTSFSNSSVLPNITETTTCSVNFIPRGGRDLFVMSVYNFSSRAVLKLQLKPDFPAVSLVNVTATAGGEPVGSWSFNRSDLLTEKSVVLSGCRSHGVVVEPGVSRVINCTNVTCDQSADVTTAVSTCAAEQVCLNNSCQKKAPLMCTVSGFTVIDFHDRLRSVPDRCGYTLVRGSSFQLVASFLERGRKDVPFLDSLRLGVSGAEISLEQGGRVLADGRLLQLNHTARLLHGVELSKVWTGVTAKFHNLTLFFNGDTAHLSAPDGAAVDGLCGNATDSTWTTDPVRQRSSTADRCDVQHSDTFDSRLNCTSSTERCELMRRGNFTACHAHVDPEPFITACTNFSCRYPPRDGAHCQPFEAYAKSCSLRNVRLGDWRSDVSCCAVTHPCVNHHCSSHEFCGRESGHRRCYCRALLASAYKANNSFGENTVCTQNSASVSLLGCLLEDQGVNHTMLHLRDNTCTGVWDDTEHLVTFTFNSTNTCGTEVVSNETELIYKNSITSVNESGIIFRHGQFRIDFSCYYKKPATKSVCFKIRNSAVVQKIVSGIWNYTLMMNAYTDSGRTDLVGSSTELDLDQKIWVELKTEDLDGSMVSIVTQSCWATDSPSPSSSPRYDLVVNGCANTADGTVDVVGNGAGTSNYFSFNMFEFSGEDANLYLHCRVELCPTQSGSCTPVCGGLRRRRSVRSRFSGGRPALITMVWGKDI